MEVIESYMRLNLKEETSYLVERSEILRRLPNVMACECVTLMNDRLCLIEAKSSAPAPRNKEDFNEFIGDISQKFTDTLLFFNALCLNRHESKSVNESVPTVLSNNLRRDYVLYLIVHGHEEAWMAEIQDALKLEMGHVLNAWGISDVNLKAVNHDTALRMHIIEKFFPVEELERMKKEGKSSEELSEIAKAWLIAG